MHKTSEEVGSHDHSVFFYNNELEFFYSALPFISGGLENNEKCYVVLDGVPENKARLKFQYLLSEQNLSLDVFLREGRLNFLKGSEVYFEGGKRFDGDRIIGDYLKLFDESISEGFRGIRLMAECPVELATKVPIATLLEYERQADGLFADRTLSAICAYSRKLITEEHIRQLAELHPIEVSMTDCPYFFKYLRLCNVDRSKESPSDVTRTIAKYCSRPAFRECEVYRREIDT